MLGSRSTESLKGQQFDREPEGSTAPPWRKKKTVVELPARETECSRDPT